MTNHKQISLKELIMISRPRWWIFTAQPFLLIYVLLAEHPDATLVVGSLFLLFPYNLLMYGINDIYDYESDIRNPRKANVMPQAQHSALWRYMLSIAGPFIAALLALGDIRSNGWLVLIIFMVFAYSHQALRWKEVPLLDSITSSFHYTSPVMYALLLTDSFQRFWPGFVAYFLWAMGNHAFGAIQDIAPDREADIKSVATEIGARATVLFVLGLYATAATLAGYYYQTVGWIAASLIGINIFGTLLALKRSTAGDQYAYRHMWTVFTYTNYLAGAVITISILSAYV